MPLDNDILGQGVYTPREAARLVGTNPQQVLRWTRGSGPNEPLWHAHFQFLDDDVTEISFTDLVEVRVVAAMRRAGISLQSIRFAISFSRERLGIDRPLASQSFKLDGSEILMEAIGREDHLVSLSRRRPGQKVFKAIVLQSLNDLEYEGGIAARWRPHGFDGVVLDPRRFFGDPILDSYGISTRTLNEDFRSYRNIRYVSNLYEIPIERVQIAISFEKDLDQKYGQGSF